MEKYDGWVIKSFNAKTPWLIWWTFAETRKEVVKKFEKAWEGESWKKYRRTGQFEIVKVKFVEVE